MTARTCELCGEPVASKRSDARFCSDACRARARRGRTEASGRIRAAITALERLAEVATKEDWIEFEDQFAELADRIATGSDTTEGGRQ